MVSSVLAHDSVHSVPGITLPPGDANLFFFFSLLAWACLRGEEGIYRRIEPRSTGETLLSYYTVMRCLHAVVTCARLS